MTFVEKIKMKKTLWLEYQKCKKIAFRAFREFDEAENAIFTSVTFETNVTEYDWPADAPCKRKLYNDFNRPVDAENPPMASNVFEYSSYCENFPGCTKTDCQHYQNYLKYIKAREKLDAANKLKDAAKKRFYSKLK